MRRVFIISMAGLLFLAACSDIRKPSDTNFTKTINQYLAKHGQACTSIGQMFPVEVPISDQDDQYGIGSQMAAFATGPFRADPTNGTQWRFKRNAVIQPIGTSLSAATFAEAVQKDSFRQTMHRISADTVQRIADVLSVPVEV